MNTFQTVNTEYLKPSRTIETVIISKGSHNKVFFIYNYEGNSFRVFENHLNLFQFFQNKNDCYFHFDTKVELDCFLSKVKL